MASVPSASQLTARLAIDGPQAKFHLCFLDSFNRTQPHLFVYYYLWLFVVAKKSENTGRRDNQTCIYLLSLAVTAIIIHHIPPPRDNHLSDLDSPRKYLNWPKPLDNDSDSSPPLWRSQPFTFCEAQSLPTPGGLSYPWLKAASSQSA